MPPIDFRPGEIVEVLKRGGHEPKRTSGQDKYVFFCVFHADGHSPNMSVDAAKNVFHCFACPAQGGVIDLARELNVDFQTSNGEMHTPGDKRSRGRPSQDELWREWAAALWTEDGAEALAILHARGLNDEVLKANSIGVTPRLLKNEVGGSWRITIPVFDDKKDLLFIRRYHPEGKLRRHLEHVVCVDDPSKISAVKATKETTTAPCPSCSRDLSLSPAQAETEIECPGCTKKLRVNAKRTKMWSRGEATIYGRPMLAAMRRAAAQEEEPVRARVFITEGEWDALMLLQADLAAVSGTAGAGTWKPAWTAMFDGLDVVVMLDADEAGTKGAAKIARAIQERSRVASLRVISLPFRDGDLLPNAGKPKDVGDWFAIGRTTDEILAAADVAEPLALVFSGAAGGDGGAGDGAGGGGAQGGFSDVAVRIDSIRELGKEVPAFRKRRLIWGEALKFLKANGRFLRTRDKDLYFFATDDRRLHVVCDEEFAAFIDEKCDLNPIEIEYKFVKEKMAAHAMRKGAQVRVRRFCHWVRETNLLYLSRFDGNIARISEGKVELVPNGTDGVVFLDAPDDCEEWSFGPDPATMPIKDAVDEVMRYIRDVRFDGLKCPPDVAGRLLFLWIVSVFFGAGLKTRPICTFIGDRGSGKCLGKGTPVVMHDGTIKAVEDVRDGDLVMGPDSKPRRVGGVTVGHGRLFRVVPTKGDPWICNEDHILTLVLGGRVDKKGRKINRFKVVDVPLADCSPTKDGTRVKGLGSAMLLRAGVTFPSQTVPNDPYLTGLLLGDGEKRIATEYLINDERTRLELLAGLLDTGECYRRGHYEIITKYGGLRDDILRLARSLGFAAYSSEKIGSIESLGFQDIYHRITISGHLDRIPCKRAPNLASPRKQRKNVLHTGFRIEPAGTGDYFGFTLDGDGRFLLGDFTVTHNTMTFRRLLQLCFGPEADVTAVRHDNQDDMQSAVMSNFLVIFDNVDQDAEFLNDELAKIATGMKIVRRRLYSTLTPKTFKPDCFVGITSHTPHFTRSDVIDRMLLFRLARRDSFGVEPAIGAADRSRFYSAVAAIAMRVLRGVREGKRPATAPYRLADWSTMAFVIGVAVGWSESEVEGLMAATEWLRVDLQAEEDPIVDLIGRWLAESDLREGREYRAAEIVTEWNAILERERAKVRYHAKWVGRKIQAAMPALSRRWNVSITHSDVDNVATYRFNALTKGDRSNQGDLIAHMKKAQKAPALYTREPGADDDEGDEEAPQGAESGEPVESSLDGDGESFDDEVKF